MGPRTGGGRRGAAGRGGGAGRNRLYAGDCAEVMAGRMAAGSVDLVFADPPYNLSGKNLKLVGNKTGGDYRMVNEDWDKMPDPGYGEFTDRWIGCCQRLLRDGGSIYVCCTMHNAGAVLGALKKSGLALRNVITWHKTNAMPSITRRTFTHSSEFVAYATKGAGWTFNYFDLKAINPERQKNGDPKQMRDVWQMPIAQGRQRLRSESGRALHPTQKPEELVRRAIVASSNRGDLVLDPFMGSGTTAVVAERLGRGWIGIERSEEYRKHALARIERSR